MVDDCGKSLNRTYIEDYRLLSPEVRPICVTGVAMYAHKSQLFFLFPQPPDPPTLPNNSSIKLFYFELGHLGLQTFCFKLPTHRCPLATRRSGAALPYPLTSALASRQPIHRTK